MLKGFILRNEKEAKALFDNDTEKDKFIRFVWDIIDERKEEIEIKKENGERYAFFGKKDSLLFEINKRSFNYYFKKKNMQIELKFEDD